jgi:hypothetical protein
MMSNEKSTVMRCVIYVGSLGGRPFQWYVQKVFVVCIFYVSPLRVECFAVCAQDSLFLFVVLAEGAYHIGIGGRPVQWYVRKVFFGCSPPRCVRSRFSLPFHCGCRGNSKSTTLTWRCASRDQELLWHWRVQANNCVESRRAKFYCWWRIKVFLLVSWNRFTYDKPTIKHPGARINETVWHSFSSSLLLLFPLFCPHFCFCRSAACSDTSRHLLVHMETSSSDFIAIGNVLHHTNSLHTDHALW